jgi:hypothetical protein
MRKSLLFAMATVAVCVAVSASLTAMQPPTPHSVVVAMNGHVTGQLPPEAKGLASMFLPMERKDFEARYLMVSQWYGVPKMQPTPGPVILAWFRAGPPPPPQATTPDKERPVIPPGAATRQNGETIVPLWMHFETAWKAQGARPDKGCPYPTARLQWRTSSNSGGYMPFSSVTEGTTSGGTGLPDHGELRMFTVDYSNAYVIVANRHSTDGFEVRLLVTCGSRMWEKLPDTEPRLP